MINPKINTYILIFMGILLTIGSIYGEKADEPVTKGLIGLLFAYVTFLHMMKVE